MRGLVASLLSVSALAWKDTIGWYDHIHETDSYGYTHSDTRAFDDLNMVQYYFDDDHVPVMDSFWCWTDGDYVYGF